MLAGIKLVPYPSSARKGFSLLLNLLDQTYLELVLDLDELTLDAISLLCALHGLALLHLELLGQQLVLVLRLGLVRNITINSQ